MKMCETREPSDSILFIFSFMSHDFQQLNTLSEKWSEKFYRYTHHENILWVIYFYFTWQHALNKKKVYLYWCQFSFDDIAACLIECNFEMTKSSDRLEQTIIFIIIMRREKKTEQYATKATDCNNIQTTIISVLSG